MKIGTVCSVIIQMPLLFVKKLGKRRSGATMFRKNESAYLYIHSSQFAKTRSVICKIYVVGDGFPAPTRKGERYTMKVTDIVRRVDDLGRIVIPKEIRRTLKIREGDPLLTTLTPIDRFCWAIHSLIQRITAR